MTANNNNENLQQKLVVQATIKDFWLAGLEMGFVMKAKQMDEIQQTKHPDIPPLVTGIKDAARVLGISQSTLSRWKESGEIDDCIYQSGKTVIFDTHKILEKLRLSNRKGKYEKFTSNNKLTKYGGRNEK